MALVPFTIGGPAAILRAMDDEDNLRHEPGHMAGVFGHISHQFKDRPLLYGFFSKTLPGA